MQKTGLAKIVQASPLYRGVVMTGGNYLGNVFKGLKTIISGKAMAPMMSLYDARYPPTKFLLSNKHKITVQCIMCGFPRSGTHWIKNVVGKSTGLITGDLFGSKPTYQDKDVVLIKVHARNKNIAYLKAKWLLPPFRFRGKYIYVYRDPRDAIISLYEMYAKKIGGETLSIKKFFKMYDPIGQYRWEINSWVLKNHSDVFLCKFEDLKQSPVFWFSRIFEFIELQGISFEEHLEEMVATVDRGTRPRGTAHGWKSTLDKYHPIIEKVTQDLHREIRLLGYDQ